MMTAQGKQKMETTLEFTNERLRLALVSSRTAAWDWDLKSGREHLFGDLRTILGIEADGYDAHIDDLRRSIHPDDVDAATKAMVRARDNKELYAAEFRVVLPNGAVKWLKATGKFYYSAEGQPQRMLGMATDITEHKNAEDAKRESDERYRQIAETTTEGISVADANFCITFVNRQMAEMLGYEPAEMLGRSVLDFVFPEDVEQERQVFERRRAGVRERYDDRFRHKDGSEVSVQIGSTPIFNGSGEFAGTLAMISDIGERKRAEQALRQREKELLEAQRVAHVGSWVWDPETDDISWSEESYRIAGRDPSLPPVSFRELGQFCMPETWERLRRAVEEALRSGTPYELDLELVGSDGAKKWFRTRGEAQRDATGRVALLRGTIQDITERKNAEEALRESESRFRNVFQDAGVGMIIASLEGRFLAVNRTFCEYLGYTEEELLRMTVEDVTQPEDWPSFSAKLREAVATRTSFQRFGKRCRHKSGCTVYTESSAFLIQSPSGEPQYFVGETVNVTERKMAEQSLADANRRLIDAQEEERARIARELHDDINQRLALLAIGLDQLRENSPESRADLEERLGDLLRQTREISSDIHSISHQLHSSKLEYLGIEATMSGFCKETGEKQRVEIHFANENVPAGVPREVSICLFRVLQEALGNAVKHSGARCFEVCLEGAPGGIRLRVSDSGVGFDSESGNGPRGLGLISMRERLRLVQGTLSIRTTPGGGTTIDAFVPMTGESASSTLPPANEPYHELTATSLTRDSMRGRFGDSGRVS
jgi:PAS domain S-box-containing protein